MKHLTTVLSLIAACVFGGTVNNVPADGSAVVRVRFPQNVQHVQSIALTPFAYTGKNEGDAIACHIVGAPASAGFRAICVGGDLKTRVRLYYIATGGSR